MRHIPDGTLRRLVDEPLAVADADVAHIGRCARCTAHRDRIAGDAAVTARLLTRPQPVPDLDDAWARLARASAGAGETAKDRRHSPVGAPSRGWMAGHRVTWRISALPAPSAAAVACLGAIAGGVVAVVALTLVPPPGRSPSGPTTAADIQDVAYVFGIGGSHVLGGFSTPSGEVRLPFGSLRWRSDGRPVDVASIAAARRLTGLPVEPVSHVPAGVGAPVTVLVQPKVTATITFNAHAGAALAGSSLTVAGGPAVIVEFGAAISTYGQFPTLATVAMEKPTAVSTSRAGVSQLAAFLLSRPDVPAALAQEIRLLGDGGGVLPIAPVAGSGVTQVDVHGSPGVLVTEGAGAASGIVWEDHSGVVHAALGLLDQEDIVNVANQLG
jgi:hypothetical protein